MSRTSGSAPLSPSVRRPGQKRAGWLLALGVCAAIAAGILGLRAYNAAMLAVDIDQLHQQVLAGGNAVAAYDNADVRFQALYPREVFLGFLKDHPGLLDRARLSGREVLWMRGAGDLVVVVKARLEGDPRLSDVTFYCAHAGNHEFRLLGISPDLMAAVPSNLKPYTEPERPRKGR